MQLSNAQIPAAFAGCVELCCLTLLTKGLLEQKAYSFSTRVPVFQAVRSNLLNRMPFQLICCLEIIKLPNNLALLLSARLFEDSRFLGRQCTRDAASPSYLAKLVCFPVATSTLSHH